MSTPGGGPRRGISASQGLCEIWTVGFHVRRAVRKTVSINTVGIEALEKYDVCVTPAAGLGDIARISTTSCVGKQVSVVKVATMGLGLWRSRQPQDTLTLSIGVSGSYAGLIKDRPYWCNPGKINFLSLPGDEQRGSVASLEACGWLIDLSVRPLVDECEKLLDDEFAFSQYCQALAVHEGFLLGSAEYLICLEQFKAHSSTVEAAKQAVQASVFENISLALADLRSVDQGASLACSARQHVDNAIAFAEASFERPITLGDICKASHVSARTLQVAFRQVRGDTPMQMLRLVRLAKLKAHLETGMDVSSACSKVGLTPTGRTAGLYQALYGEKPSDTFRKNLSTLSA